MESDTRLNNPLPIGEINTPISETSPKANDNPQNIGGNSAEERIFELSAALNVVKDKYHHYKKDLHIKICVWGIICVLIVVFCGFLSKHLLKETFPNNWSWQIVYCSIIRVTIAGAIFSLSSFCFKILKSYIHLSEKNNHRIAVIQSMANLVGAAKDDTQRNIIYTKLINIIVDFEDPGLISSDKDFKGVSSVGLDAIIKILNSKKE